MRKDHRPYALKRLLGRFERFWVNHFIRPQLDSMGQHPMVMKPWNLKLYGAGIHFGESIHVITAKDRTVRLTTWAMHQHQGHIELDDYVLLCPGVRIDSASRVRIGASSMLAAGVYITDADWHDLYDRTRAIGTTAPVTLGENVWVGDGSIVCKGVNIGRNSVIGAGSVVASDIPDNVIAAGNPAKVIRLLDPSQPLHTRAKLLQGADQLAADMEAVERYMHSGNSWLRWLQSSLWPGPED